MIDWERVKNLRSEIGAEDFAEIATMFLQEADEAILLLTPGMTAPVLEANLHFLKGAALNLGFTAVAALCHTGERSAASGDVNVDLTAVRASYFTSKQAFQTGMARLSIA